MRLKLEIYYRDGILYKKDTYLPEFSWKIQPCQWDDTAKILLRSRKKEYLCKCRPTDYLILVRITSRTNSSLEATELSTC